MWIRAVIKAQLLRHGDEAARLKELDENWDAMLVAFEIPAKLFKQLWSGLLNGGGRKHVADIEESAGKNT